MALVIPHKHDVYDDSIINIIMDIIIIGPHRSTTYVDAACCHRQSSVVCLSVCYSSEPRLWTRVGPRNYTHAL